MEKAQITVTARQLPPPILVDTPAGFDAMLDHLAVQPVLALDTESNSLYRYHYRVCLIQISSASRDYLLDPIRLPRIEPFGSILADPAILILDEATSSVDTRTEARIQNALLRLMKGRTSFVIAHRLSTIRGANHVLVINDGQIAEEDNHQQLMDKQGVYYKLYQAQFKGQAI